VQNPIADAETLAAVARIPDKAHTRVLPGEGFDNRSSVIARTVINND
jgi:hypothetical protein